MGILWSREELETVIYDTVTNSAYSIFVCVREKESLSTVQI